MAQLLEPQRFGLVLLLTQHSLAELMPLSLMANLRLLQQTNLAL
jgi:hypothetical protein